MIKPGGHYVQPHLDASGRYDVYVGWQHVACSTDYQAANQALYKLRPYRHTVEIRGLPREPAIAVVLP